MGLINESDQTVWACIAAIVGYLKYLILCYAPNFDKVEGAYWVATECLSFRPPICKSYVSLYVFENNYCWGLDIS